MNETRQSRITPNTFQNPNDLVDRYMRWLDGDEVKCYVVVVRKTFGWMKQKDRISKSQIAGYTGLSDDRVNACMKNLVSFGLILRTNDDAPSIQIGAEWSLQLDDDCINEPAMIARWNEWKEANTRRAEKMRAKKLQGGDVAHTGSVAQAEGGDVAHIPQKPLSKASKKNIQEKKSSNINTDEPTPSIVTQRPDFKSLNPIDYRKVKELRLFMDATGWIPGSFVLEVVYDFVQSGLTAEAITAAFREWTARGYKPANVKGYLEWARDGIPDAPGKRYAPKTPAAPSAPLPNYTGYVDPNESKYVPNPARVQFT